MFETSTVWNQRTNRQPCDHDTQPKAWVQGRIDSARDWLFVEIGISTSWKFDKRIPRDRWADMIPTLFGEWASQYGATPGMSAMAGHPDFRNREARIWIREVLGRGRGCYKIYVSFIEHNDECYF